MGNIPQKRFFSKIISPLESSDFLRLIISSDPLGNDHRSLIDDVKCVSTLSLADYKVFAMIIILF